jgi:hypothetical protein
MLAETLLQGRRNTKAESKSDAIESCLAGAVAGWLGIAADDQDFIRPGPAPVCLPFGVTGIAVFFKGKLRAEKTAGSEAEFWTFPPANLGEPCGHRGEAPLLAVQLVGVEFAAATSASGPDDAFGLLYLAFEFGNVPLLAFLGAVDLTLGTDQGGIGVAVREEQTVPNVLVRRVAGGDLLAAQQRLGELALCRAVQFRPGDEKRILLFGYADARLVGEYARISHRMPPR